MCPFGVDFFKDRRVEYAFANRLGDIAADEPRAEKLEDAR